MSGPEKEQAMSLAERLRKLRDDKGMSLDELAIKAQISKTYLWELERDTSGTKKPSADVLMRISKALSTTLADLLSIASIQIEAVTIEVPPALQDFQGRMANQGTPLTPEDVRDLALMKFRGGQPQTADEWHQLYLVMVNTLRKRAP